MPFDVMCYREYKVNNNFGYAQENGYSKSLIYVYSIYICYI